MQNNKIPYVYNHILEIEERIEIIKKNLKWISSDIKFIKKISKPQENK